ASIEIYSLSLHDALPILKKCLFFMCALVVFSIGSVQSQEIRLGAKLGLNVASLGGDAYGVGSLGARTSFHIGGLAEIPLMGKFRSEEHTSELQSRDNLVC